MNLFKCILDFSSFVCFPNKASTGILSTPQKIGTSGAPKTTATAASASAAATAKRSSSKSNVTTSLQTINKTNIIPVIVPRSSPRPELSSDSASSDSAKETDVGRTIQSDIQSKFSSFRNVPNIREDSDKADVSKSGFVASRNTEQHELLGHNAISSGISVTQAVTVAGANNLDDVRRVVTARVRTNLFRDSAVNYDEENCKF